VGSFAANQFGLYDMGGNVWQWCEDEYFPHAANGLSAGWLKNVYKFYLDEACKHKQWGGGARVVRGAAWNNDGRSDLLSSRRGHTSDDRGINFGFRVVLCDDSFH
jgi:formylglycine-generating enzyme required for sulfatase activity